jgi:hypothetical protein
LDTAQGLKAMPDQAKVDISDLNKVALEELKALVSQDPRLLPAWQSAVMDLISAGIPAPVNGLKQLIEEGISDA